MNEAWPALCTLLALVLLLVFIIRYQLNAFVALLVVSLGLGLGAGLPPARVLEEIGIGIGKIMRGVAVILALGAMLGRMLDASGAAEVIARTLIKSFGPRRASLAILVAAYLIGIPVLFGVGFLLLIPIMYRLQRETGESLLWFVLPLCFSLGTMHSLVPPHPGIVAAVKTMAPDQGHIMVQTILFGTLMGIPVVLIGWLGPGRFWAKRQFVTVPEHLGGESTPSNPDAPDTPKPSFILCVLIVTLPLLLSVIGFSAQLADRAGAAWMPSWMKEPLLEMNFQDGWGLVLYSPLEWLKFFGDPTLALLVPTGLAFWLLGMRRGMNRAKLAKIAGDSLQDVGGILFLFGAAGGFMQVIEATGAGKTIAHFFTDLQKTLPLTPVLICYLVAVLMRIALGSATAAISIASSLLTKFVQPGHETLLILAVANGVTFMTQPADSGFWMVKEYANLSVKDVMVRFNSCRITMSLTGLGLLLLAERWIF
jgi:Gnt-I system low-affinity gluconate transporter